MYNLSDIEAAVLGLLCEGPQYGYNIEKIVEDRGMRNWTEIGFSSIYYVLKKLQKNQLIESEIKETKGKPARKIYTITPLGWNAMEEKVKTVLSVAEKQIHPFDLGIANLKIISPEESIRCLKSYVKSVNKRISFLEESIATHNKLKSPYFVVALFERPLVHLKNEKQWVLDLIEKIKKEENLSD
ncbi:PadR family transcriptional regulator [Methanobacterium alcaliphilum]|uniref:PadR family transcriptional regulator n=1 Tax=Methanobacterium alcaliphilum TaxID=392018 RepID=UPI00200B1F07|nr:PadR family transcriptional regulator [Methanobacterium alcaliphilum]MCK9150541.1 PadR family transcriptional regulator [Methanobacterium alcaliphilum]